jgi:hypothetical protein
MHVIWFYRLSGSGRVRDRAYIIGDESPYNCGCNMFILIKLLTEDLAARELGCGVDGGVNSWWPKGDPGHDPKTRG